MIKKVCCALALAAALGLCATAQTLTLKGVYNNNRYDDHADHNYSEYVGYLNGKAIFIVENGIYRMDWDGENLDTPYKEPAVNKSDFFANGQFTDVDKALWATNFNLMVGNSGAVIADGVITTVFSRTDDQTAEDGSNRFTVRKWNAETGDLLSSQDFPESACLQSSGMCVNPKDGKVYGLFYLTAQDLPEEITSDPDFFVDTDGDATATDAGYCICSVDLETMQITPITPGLYYSTFVTFAINADGRAFAMTSGGTAGVEGEDGKLYNMYGELTGAQLCEFDLATGLMLQVPVEMTDPETGETYIENVNKYPASGYNSQVSRQSACFSKANPNIMYWNGFYNSGKGFNDYGSWGTLPDRDWKNNGKYDTSLYAVDITTGETTRLTNIDNRYSFSCMWAVEEEQSDYRDVNADGKWDIADLNILINIMLGHDKAENYNGRAFITEGDEVVDIADVNACISIMLGQK
jgi:hypothetical protein